MQNKAVVRHMAACACVLESEGDREEEEEEATLEGDSCGSQSGPQRLGPRRKAGLLERRKMEGGGGVVYLDMLYSVFNARITIKMLRLISYVYKTV